MADLEDRQTKRAKGSTIDLHAQPVQDTADGFDSEDDTSPVCWICLGDAAPGNCLVQACGCPRYSHAVCCARWQLQMAGTRRETHCEFCDKQLPNWKVTLTPPCGAEAPAVMNVNFDSKTYSFEVKPGPAGYQQFTEAIRRAFSLPEDSELNITFTCDEPSTGLVNAGALLTLQGPGAYDAAVHCASVSAARRIMQQKEQPIGAALPHTAHSVQSYRHFDATRPVPQLVVPLSPSAGSGSEPCSSGSSQSGDSGRRPPGSTGGERSERGTGSSANSGGSGGGKKRWAGMLTRRMRSALCEMWRPQPDQEEGSTMC